MKCYLDNGANSYFAWNMVLNETGMSAWHWRQNALITVNRHTGEAIFNGEYYVMQHFSRYVKSGAKRVLMTGPWGDKIAFVNPGGSVVLVVDNSANRSYEVTFEVAGSPGIGTFKVTLPAESINTFTVAPK